MIKIVLIENLGNSKEYNKLEFGKIVVHFLLIKKWKSFSSKNIKPIKFSNLIGLKIQLKKFELKIYKVLNKSKKIKNIYQFLENPQFLENCVFSKNWYKEVNHICFFNMAYDLRKGNFILSSKIYGLGKIKSSLQIFCKAKKLIIIESVYQLLMLIFKNKFVTDEFNSILINKKINNFNFNLSKTVINKFALEGKIVNFIKLIKHQLLVKNIILLIDDILFINLLWKILKYNNKKTIGLGTQNQLTILLTNIYLHKFDLFILKWLKQQNNLKSIFYRRYHDNFILLGIPTQQICKILKIKLYLLGYQNFNLRTLRLCSKNVLKNKILFKGFELFLNSYVFSANKNIFIIFHLPKKLILKKLLIFGYCCKNGIPQGCSTLLYKSLKEIILNYLILQQKIKNYYFLCSNYYRFSIRLYYILKYSCVFTFMFKLKLKTRKKIFKKFGKYISLPTNNIFFIKFFY